MNGILVIGPESAGTRVLTRLLINAGCGGDDSHEQAFDSVGLPDPIRPIVWRRSFPHGGACPDVKGMLGNMAKAGYNPVVVVITRDWHPHICSHKKWFAGANHEELIRDAYINIFTSLRETDAPFIVTNYEALTKGNENINALLRALDLPEISDAEIFDGDKKWVRPEMTLEKVRDYLDEDYWERGKSTGKSGYENWSINREWDNGLIECLNSVYPVADKCTLDLGCAMGGIVLSMLKSGADSFGIDLSHYAVEKGKALYPELEARTFEGSIHELPFNADMFDFIYSNQVFEHLPAALVPAMFEEVKRVMKPGAVAWVGLVFGSGFGCEDPADKTHITLYPLEWWKSRVEEAGLIFDMSFDEAFRKTKTAKGYSYFETFNWHAFSFRKAAE